MAASWLVESSSFRDPSGFVFRHEGTLYRQVNRAFGGEYRRLIDSGLYDELVSAGLLVQHEEVPLRLPQAPPAFTVIKPSEIPFISYPYEWCFSQLRAAALLTLDVQKRALRRGLTLRDASAYNVQFVGWRPILIDTLSFGSRAEGSAWAAYRQFCQHFLAPLALMAYAHPSLGQLSRVHIDGLPLDMVRDLLPRRTWTRPGLLMHVHLHARAAEGASRRGTGSRSVSANVTQTAALALNDSLERAVRRLKWEPPSTLWSTYTVDCNYSAAAQEEKRRLVGECVDEVRGRTELRVAWDLGANTGDYSRILARITPCVVSFDLDPAVVERHFRGCQERNETVVLPLVQDLTNPSGAMGWHHSERRSLVDRGPADLVVALALIHHLALGANVPLVRIAALLRDVARYLIIEFVPKEDSQVQRMMATREDVFPSYTQHAFEAEFSTVFHVLRRMPIAGTERTLYLMQRR